MAETKQKLVNKILEERDYDDLVELCNIDYDAIYDMCERVLSTKSVDDLIEML